MSEIKDKVFRSRFLRMLLAVVLVFSSFGTILPPTVAAAAESYNDGNPFENGDLVWDDNTQKWRANGLGFFATLNSEHPNQAPPFDYPFVATAHGPEFDGWGTSSFSATIWEAYNTRGLHYDNGLPAMTHCCQRDNKTPTLGVQRPGRAILLENLSGWGADGVYTGWFAVLIDNDHLHQNFDQASLGTTYIKMRWKDTGYLDVVKTSANKKITDNNNCYSLAGAKYGIYTDKDCKKQIGTITTDDKGYAKSSALAVGTYYVKETKAPKGYALDTHVYPVTVVPGQTVPVNGGTVTDIPQSDPPSMWVGKIDLETTLNMPQGSASLAGAEFEVKYYDGYYNDVTRLPSSATRTWIVSTDEDGFALLKDSYKVSGDAFYYTSSGDVTIPLGTVTIQEIKAPEGYLLNDSTVYLRQVTGEGVLEDVETYDIPIVKEQLERGGLSLIKFVNETENYDNQIEIKTPAQNVKFEIINDNENSVKVNDEVYAPGEVVMTITTNEAGYATTGSKALPYGSYIVHEVASTTPQGYEPVQDFSVVVSEDSEMYSFILEDKLTLSPLRVVKVDSETGKQIPAFVSYKLLDEDLNPITFTTYYPETVVHETFTATADGTLTFPERLREGTYYLQEVKAPEGYVLSDELLEVTIDQTHSWDNPAVVEFKNTPIKGSVTIVKTDEYTGQAVSGAEYSIRAVGDVITSDGTIRFANDEIVASGILTDENGSATVENLYLGTYKVYETKSPAGYALDTVEHLVEIVSEGQDVPVVKMRQDVVDTPTTLKVYKTDNITGEKIAGAKFRIWQDGAEGKDVYDYENIVSHAEAAILEKYEETESATLNNGEEVIEAFANAQADDTIAFKLNVINTDQTASTYELTAKFNDDNTITVTYKNDVLCTVESKHFVDPDAFITEQITDENGEIVLTYLLPGKYNILEIEAPDGYILDEDSEAKTFEVDEQGMINGKAAYEFTMQNDFTKIDISKKDITTNEEIEGATLVVEDAEGNVIDEWVSGKETHRIEHLVPGTYTLTETMAPATYEFAQSIEFEVLPTGKIQHVVMYDEPIEISGEIDKRQTIAGGGESYQYTIDYRSTSSTWADELNVIDPLECVNEGLTRVTSIQTPVSFEDWDGEMYVFYQTKMGDNASDVNPLAKNPFNAWNENNESMQDWSDWNLWATVSTLESSTLNVSDLNLADGDYITAIGFAHGRVEKDFTTRLDSWDRENLKSEHDNMDKVTVPHGDSFDLINAQGLTKTEKSTSVNYSPAVISMDIISEDYYNGTAELWNSAEMNIWRNKGLVPEKLYDEDQDKVVQTFTPTQPGTDTYDKTGDMEALIPYLVGLALCLLGAGASVAYLVRKKQKNVTSVNSEDNLEKPLKK